MPRVQLQRSETELGKKAVHVSVKQIESVGILPESALHESGVEGCPALQSDQGRSHEQRTLTR